MEEKEIENQLSDLKFEIIKIKSSRHNRFVNRLKKNLSDDFKLYNIEFDEKMDEIFDLVDCVSYCWEFYGKYSELYFITLYWLHTIIMDEIVDKNEKGYIRYEIYFQIYDNKLSLLFFKIINFYI